MDNQVADRGDVALVGADGQKAEQLLQASRREGAAVLTDITRRALQRWLAHGAGTLLSADRLFNDAERQDLQAAIAATNATAGLLGRSRIRLRQQSALKRYAPAKFAELEAFCGGPGSGRPGPCPQNRPDVEAAAAAQSVATRATKSVASKQAALDRAKILGKPERIARAQQELVAAQAAAGEAVAEATRLEMEAAKNDRQAKGSGKERSASKPEPKPAEQPEAGKFKPSQARIEAGGATERQIAQALGGDWTAAKVAAVAGAPDDAKVTITKAGSKIEVEAVGPPAADGRKSYILQRSVMREGDKVVIDNDLFKVHPDLRNSGLGARIFARQVENAAASGVDRFDTYAAGIAEPKGTPQDDATYNGYYTWPRLGYDGGLTKSQRNKLPDTLQGATRISDVMKTPEGRDWWRYEAGAGAEVRFDLKPGSQSRRVLEGYLKERAITDYAEPAQLPANDTDGVEPILLTPADEEILERIWAQVAAEGDSGAVEQFSEHWQFSEPTAFEIFDDAELQPLPPAEALAFFQRKVALPGQTAKQLSDEENRKGFTLAVRADQVVLDKVKQAIQGVIETGQDVSATPRLIAALLRDAGIEQTVGGRRVGGAYVENLFRTNMMESYRAGAQQELAEVADDFPVWRFVGIADGRQRATHAIHNDKFFPSSVTFEEVRDSVKGEFDGYQCRCDFIPIYVSEWKRLQAAGSRIEPGWVLTP